MAVRVRGSGILTYLSNLDALEHDEYWFHSFHSHLNRFPLVFRHIQMIDWLHLLSLDQSCPATLKVNSRNSFLLGMLFRASVRH